MQDNISKLITEHDHEQFTLDQLIKIAKKMFDDPQFGDTKNARIMLFSMIYATHIKSGDSTKIAQAYQTDSTFGAEINKGVKLGLELRKFIAVGAENDSNENLDFGSHKPDQRIYFGTPGGGKSYKVKDKIKDKNASERSFRTTFHPETDYASFVGSYKPVMDGKEITYQFIPQIFTKAYIAAWNDPKSDYYLVIEEINRGNCAQIFGDLFQLLDRNNENGFSEYGIVADADLRKYLETAVDEYGSPILINKQGIHKGELLLPPNLSILATMNTSDQSLFPMDSAFKRRWAWEFVPSSYKESDNYELTFGNKTHKWHNFLKAVNPRIKEATDSEDKQLGAYFIKSNMNAEEFKSKVMYYLWSEICKEEYKTRNNFFRHKVGDKPDVEFTFNELYKDGAEDATLLNEFMEYLKIGEQ